MAKIYYIPYIRELILEYIEKNKMDVRWFCKYTWISRGTYYKIINNKVKHLKTKTIDKLKKVKIVW